MNFKNYVGYVVKNDYVTKEHLIHVTIGKWGKVLPATADMELEFHQDYLYPADIEPDLESKFDLSFIKDLTIDWSLLTWDKALFEKTLKKDDE